MVWDAVGRGSGKICAYSDGLVMRRLEISMQRGERTQVSERRYGPRLKEGNFVRLAWGLPTYISRMPPTGKSSASSCICFLAVHRRPHIFCKQGKVDRDFMRVDLLRDLFVVGKKEEVSNGPLFRLVKDQPLDKHLICPFHPVTALSTSFVTQ